MSSLQEFPVTMEGVHEEDPSVINATTSATESECDPTVKQLSESVES